jgi:dipeptidyl aminopeptidase/acylaminoacyl peptidase
MARQRKRAIGPEDVYELRAVSQATVSPDGRRVAYVLTSADREVDRNSSSIWVTCLDGREDPRAFATIGQATSPSWSPDGRSLAFVSNRGQGSQIFIAPLDGGEPRQLTHADASSTDPCWSPDGRRIAFVRSVGRKRGKGQTAAERNAPLVIRDIYYKLDGFGLYDERRRHLFAIDVETGEEWQLTDGDWHDTQQVWSPDGRFLAFVSDRSRERWNHLWRGDVWMVPSRGGRVRCLTRGRGAAAAPAFSPDGKTVAFVGHEYGDDSNGRNIQLMLVSTGGRRAPRSLTHSLDLSVSGYPVAPFGRPFEWLPDGQGLVFTAPERGAVPIWGVDRAGGGVKKLLDADLQVSALALSPNGRELVFSASSSSHFPEIFAVSLQRGGSPRRISGANSKLADEVELAPTRRISYRSHDGLEVEAFLIFPLDYRQGRHYPVDVNIHGGPHGAHPTAHNAIRHQALAAAGYVVLLPNPRGSAGYGEEFERACLADWGGADYRDIMAGVDELIRSGIADPERLFVSGYSYGGYMSSWIVGQTDRFSAAAIGAPVTNLSTSFTTDDVLHNGLAEMRGTPFTHPEEYVARSPITHLPRVKTPVLLMHWEGDLRCPIAQSEEFFAGLKLLNRKVEFVRYPGGSHVARSPSQEVDSIRRVLDWYRLHARSRRR